jgi:hypothetical protein
VRKCGGGDGAYLWVNGEQETALFGEFVDHVMVGLALFRSRYYAVFKTHSVDHSQYGPCTVHVRSMLMTASAVHDSQYGPCNQVTPPGVSATHKSSSGRTCNQSDTPREW